jgi:hypothetical protein
MSELDDLFRGALNTEGYGFQHAVVQQIHAHSSNTWEAVVTEFPVAYRDRATHIDVLAWCYNRKGLLVGECKRVNPKFGNWVFARSPFTFDRYTNRTWLQKLVPADHTSVVARTAPVAIPVNPFHLAVEVKTPGSNKDVEGDVAGQPKGKALSQSLTQVAEGVNGLLDMLQRQKTLLRTQGEILFIPTIFTTATLYATENATLNLADLDTGHIPDATFEKKPWLWFEHNVSPNLLAEIQHEGFSGSQRFRDMLPAMHTRAIAIVSHEGVSSFLRAAANLVHQLVEG